MIQAMRAFNWQRAARIFWALWLLVLAAILIGALHWHVYPAGWEWFTYGAGFVTAVVTLFDGHKEHQ